MRETPAAWVDFDQIAWVSITLPEALRTEKQTLNWGAHHVSARSGLARTQAFDDHVRWLQTTKPRLGLDELGPYDNQVINDVIDRLT